MRKILILMFSSILLSPIPALSESCSNIIKMIDQFNSYHFVTTGENETLKNVFVDNVYQAHCMVVGTNEQKQEVFIDMGKIVAVIS